PKKKSVTLKTTQLIPFSVSIERVGGIGKPGMLLALETTSISTPGTPGPPGKNNCGSARKKPLGKVTRASPRKYPLTAVGNDRYSAPVRILDVSLSAVMISPAFHRYTALSYRPTTAGRASEMRVPAGWDFTMPFIDRSTRKACVLPVPSIPVTRTISPPSFASNGNIPAYFAVPESIH